ncbi:MAG TPA: sugar transferase [Blastocatellia bacterium]|jgi:lipopolysaccharide/colanic/teichoic acid biosynthesis glycosyltransferase|nr:sugar transferase [Blastocatellia bacterium]
MDNSSDTYRRTGKHAFDLALTLLTLPVTLPLMATLAFAVRLKLGSPVLFKQERLGLKGEPFFIRKFRTMTDVRDAEGNLLPDAERLTRLGKFLRATSLDELPELINVLRGEMSLVGPRPLYSHYRERYTPEQFRRHDVLPGITGWAQVNGRNAISWEAKFERDNWYVDHCSLRLDVKILALTLLKIIKREGISQPGHATAEEFEGSLHKGA